MVGYKQRLRLRLLLKNVQQMKRPHPCILDAGSAAAATVDTMYYRTERTYDRDHDDGISILSGGMRRKGKLTLILRK